MSESFIATTNFIFSLGTLVLQAGSLILLIGLIGKDRSRIFAFFSKNSTLIVFLVSFGGALGSLFYQYVIGFEPCMWCWYQRMAMYPIAIITLTALLKKKVGESLNYSFILGIIGALLAVFHLLEKTLGKELVPCGINGPSCLQDLVNGFGYIDIPVMSLSIFAFIVLVILNKRRFSSI